MYSGILHEDSQADLQELWIVQQYIIPTTNLTLSPVLFSHQWLYNAKSHAFALVYESTSPLEASLIQLYPHCLLRPILFPMEERGSKALPS